MNCHPSLKAATIVAPMLTSLAQQLDPWLLPLFLHCFLLLSQLDLKTKLKRFRLELGVMDVRGFSLEITATRQG